MYRGRFAPSPTGPLHLGSLVAAAASYLDALSHGGHWLVRMEDVDEPRCSPQHAATILRQLEAYGFAWQGEVVYQSQRKPAYRAALNELQRKDAVFGCACTRSELGNREFYPGTCRHGLAAGRTARAWRLRVDDAPIEFTDRSRGFFSERLTDTIGDFVLLRADGFFAYQLAVVVDDGWQGITDVVRGEDLLSSTARQIFLQRQLGLPQPRYLHVGVVTDAQGHKLSKQTKAPPLPLDDVARTLAQAFEHLGLTIALTNVAEMWQVATSQWPYSPDFPGGTGTGGGLNA